MKVDMNDPIEVLKRMNQDDAETAAIVTRPSAPVAKPADQQPPRSSLVAHQPQAAVPASSKLYTLPTSGKFEPIIGDHGFYRPQNAIKAADDFEHACDMDKLYRWNCVRAPNDEPWILYQTANAIGSANLDWFGARAEIVDPAKDLAALVASAPEPTPRQRQEQRMSFAYGNLAASTNHKPQRAAFKQVALKEGWTEAEFDAWAAGRTWA